MQRRERVCCAVLVVVQIFHVARCNVQLKVGAIVVVVVVERQLRARSRVTARGNAGGWEAGMHLVRQLDVAAAGCFIAPTARHIADGVAAAAENKHGLAVPVGYWLRPKTEKVE